MITYESLKEFIIKNSEGIDLNFFTQKITANTYKLNEKYSLETSFADSNTNSFSNVWNFSISKIIKDYLK